MSRRNKWLLAVAYLAFFAILVEGGAYLVVSKLRDNALGDVSERHHYSSIRSHKLNPAYQRRLDTDGQRIHSEDGFRRDRPVSKEKPAGTFRIFVMGGSALYGIGSLGDGLYPNHRTLFNDETIPHFLEQELNSLANQQQWNLDVEVINVGVVAYQTYHHVLYFYETLFEYDPDMVVFLDGHNDFYNIGVKSPIREFSYSANTMIDALNDRQPFFTLYITLRYFGQYSYFFKMLEKGMQILYERYEAPPYNIEGDYTAIERDFAAELEETAKVGFLRNYKLLKTFAEDQNFDMQIFLQPEVVFEDVNLLSEHDRNIRQITADRYGPNKVEAMTRARAEFPRMFAAAGLPYADIGTLAGDDASDDLYIDYCHMTAAGSKRAAALMLPVIASRIAAGVS